MYEIVLVEIENGVRGLEIPLGDDFETLRDSINFARGHAAEAHKDDVDILPAFIDDERNTALLIVLTFSDDSLKYEYIVRGKV